MSAPLRFFLAAAVVVPTIPLRAFPGTIFIATILLTLAAASWRFARAARR